MFCSFTRAVLMMLTNHIISVKTYIFYPYFVNYKLQSYIEVLNYQNILFLV